MKSIIIKKIQLSRVTKEELIQQISSYAFTPESGEGVRIIHQDYEHIACHYLVESIYRQDTYNYDTGEFEKIDYKRVNRTLFFIDFKLQTLDIMGNKLQAEKVIEFIGKISSYRLPISDAPVNLIRLINSWRNSGVTFNVTRLKLSDYTFFDSIVGNCVLNLTGYPKAMEVLKTYEKQIVNVSLNVTLEDACTITFYKSGAVSIYKDIDDIDLSLVRLLKEGVQGGETNA